MVDLERPLLPPSAAAALASSPRDELAALAKPALLPALAGLRAPLVVVIQCQHFMYAVPPLGRTGGWPWTVMDVSDRGCSFCVFVCGARGETESWVRSAHAEQTIRERDPFSTNLSLTPLLPHPPTRTLPQAHGDDLFGMIFFVLSG